jgi:hypothetical protein
MYIEVEENPNCPAPISARFKELGPARLVKQVRVEGRSGGEELCSVTGWCDDPDLPLCPAYAQKVEESGMGTAYLVYGGNWGIRLKPARLLEGWDISSPDQWGEPFLLLGDPRSIVFVDAGPEAN